MTVATRRAAALVVAICMVLPAGCAHTIARTPPAREPHNIVLMIGDGMGVAHLTGARIAAGRLEMERLPVGGLESTWSANRLVTDSAASGTAYATGSKTLNGTVSMSPEGEPLKTVREHAEDRGMATGLVVTCSVTHATPAVFASHVAGREDDLEIARQIAESDVEVLFGGGRSFFLPRGESHGARTDGQNLLDTLRARMPVALSADEFRNLGRVERAAALLADEHPGPAGDRDPDLRELTEKALEVLSSDQDGFFLMVEGSQIDWAGHENEHDWLVDEVLDFDSAVGAVLDFAERDGRTLVIVTADHETGGYTLLDGSLERRAVTEPDFACDEHTATMVPLLAYGPGSEAFGGIGDNAAVGRRLVDLVTARPRP
jgi:alkaline phosphatase